LSKFWKFVLDILSHLYTAQWSTDVKVKVKLKNQLLCSARKLRPLNLLVDTAQY